MSKTGKLGGAILGVALIGGAVVGINCMEKVPAGYVGVVYNFSSGISDQVLSQGWHLVSPTKKVTTYSIGIEQSYLTSEDKGDSPENESFSTPTSDGKSLTVDLEFSYKFDPDKITHTFTMFKGQSGKTVKDSFIKPKMRAWTQNLIAEYRSNYNKQVKAYKRYVRNPIKKMFLNLTGYEKQEYQYLSYDVSSNAPQNLFGEEE